MKKTNLNLFLVVLMASLLFVFNGCQHDDLEDFTPIEDTNLGEHGAHLRNCSHEIPEKYKNQVSDDRAAISYVVPIILIPSGSSVTTQQMNQIKMGLENVRFWYQKNLPSKDLRWSKLKVLHGKKTAAHYRVDNNVWKEMPGEIKAAFGWNPWESGSTNHIALVLGRDLEGWAGGAGFADGRGIAINGVESLVDLAQVSGNWWGTQDYWHGTTIHELGHALTLPHNTIPNSIMNAHGDYKNKVLSSGEATQVQGTAGTTWKHHRPKAKWTFDSKSGTMITDESGYGNHLWAKNGANVYNSSMIEKSAYSNGTTHRFETSSNKLNVKNQLTISVWVKPYSTDGMIVNKWYAPDSYALSMANGRFRFSVATPGGTWGQQHFVSAPIKKYFWQHVVCKYTGSSIQIYVDGKLKMSTNVSGNLQASTRPVSVGGHSASAVNGFRGYVDNLTIYDKSVWNSRLFTY